MACLVKNYWVIFMRRAKLGKLVSLYLTQDSPLKLTDAEVPALIGQLKQRLETLGQIRINQYNDQEVLIDFRVDVTNSLSHHYWGERFNVIRDKNGQLFLYYQNMKLGGFAGIDEIIELLKAHIAQLRRLQAQTAKREAVRQLRAQTLIAAMKPVAKAQQCDFRVDYNNQCCWLYIRIAEREMLGIRIPWKQLQNTLPKLDEAICKIRELRTLGIRFGFMHYVSYHADWIRWAEL